MTHSPSAQNTERDAERAADLLASVFGHEAFRPGQERVVASVMAGRDTLAVMPTGGGKSLCYQVPALLGMPHDPGGLTLVVCPLVSLMKDQRESLLGKLRRSAAAGAGTGADTDAAAAAEPGRMVAALHSKVPAAERRLIEEDVLSGTARILFVAPERLRSLAFCLMLKRRGVSLFVVDEAHCISEWGHDFRPEYLFVGEAARDLTGKDGRRPPILALTATAAPKVRRDVVRLLDLGENRGEVISGVDRPNLSYSVVPIREEDRLAEVLAVLQDRPLPAVVYANSRRQTEEIAAGIRRADLPGLSGHTPASLGCAEAYHAGMAPHERDRVQDLFMAGEIPIIVATIAFGMGIDKPNIRTVVHATIPRSLPAYVQEAGRAGRDGGPSSCTVLFSAAEIVKRRRLAAAGATPTDDALAYFGALRRRALAQANAQANGAEAADAPARADVPQAELLCLAGLAPDRARDSLRALEAIGRVKRRYDLWESAAVRRLPRPAGGPEASPEKLGGAASRLLAAIGAPGSPRGERREIRPLAELAAVAGVPPITAQVLLAKLASLGLIEAEGRGGTLAGLLMKTDPLSRREEVALEARLTASSHAALAHLDDIERYASPDACRRQRIIDHFEEEGGPGSAPRVAPCGGCDVCAAAAGPNTDPGTDPGAGPGSFHHAREAEYRTPGAPGGQDPRRGGHGPDPDGTLWGRIKGAIGGLLSHPAAGAPAAAARPADGAP